jgi:hypothetical protein
MWKVTGELNYLYQRQHTTTSAVKKVCALAKLAKLIQAVSTELCRNEMLDGTIKHKNFTHKTYRSAKECWRTHWPMSDRHTYLIYEYITFQEISIIYWDWTCILRRFITSCSSNNKEPASLRQKLLCISNRYILRLKVKPSAGCV